MNKYFTLIMFFLFVFFSKAQIRKNEISIRVGNNFLNEIPYSLRSQKIIQMLSNEKINETKTQLPLIFVNYKGSLSKIWDVEFVVGHERYHQKTSSKTQKKDLSSKTFFHSLIAMGGNFNYIKKEVLQLYSGFGFGVKIHSSETKIDENYCEVSIAETEPHFQFTLLGFRYGEKIAINSEVGFGYKGIINAGLSYRF